MLSVYFKIISFIFVLSYSSGIFAHASKSPVDLNSIKQRQVAQEKLNADPIDTSKQRPFTLKNNWVVLEEATASESNSSNVEGQKRIGSFKLSAGANSSSERNFDKAKPMVLFQSRTKSMGLLTGTLVLRLKSKDASINEILNRYNLKLIQSFPHLSLYYVTSNKEIFDLEASKNALSKDQMVKSVDVEIVSRIYEKK